MLGQEKIGKIKKEKGYTLIEILVSIAIFSLVMVVALGSILTIIDANKKARTLTSVMNNVHYTMEYMTRALKMGKNIDVGGVNGSGADIAVDAINYNSTDAFDRKQRVIFIWKVVGDKGTIYRKIGIGGAEIPLTSPEVDIDYASFEIKRNGGADAQPRVFITLLGSVSIGERIQSKFNIQTSVSQRPLVFPTTPPAGP